MASCSLPPVLAGVELPHIPGESTVGWLTAAEGEALARLAAGRVVLELGSFAGLTTLHLAATARHVHTVDHHKGDAGTGAADTLPALWHNLGAADARGRVSVHAGRFEDVLPRLAPGSFDLVFVDGAHDRKSVEHDAAEALRLVRPGGTVAFHDWAYSTVQAVVPPLLGPPTGVEGSLAWYDLPAPETRPCARAKVFLAVPCYDAVIPQALDGLSMATEHARWTRQVGVGSLLALVFNRLWAGALNSRAGQGWTHFAMMHADQEAPAGWLDTLLDELDRVGADVLSVAVPIKDGRGLTSTGMQERAGPVTRLTMTELMALPETFDAADVRRLDPARFGAADNSLAVNTGLWVCRFDGPWVEEFPGFNVADSVVRHPDGVFRAHAWPEDWKFSRWCADRGLRVFATRKVRVGHHGKAAYWNTGAWGTMKHDEGDN